MFFRKKKYNFDGWDWSELQQFFNLPDEDDMMNEDKPLREFLSKVRDDVYRLDLVHHEPNYVESQEDKKTNEIVKVCRSYLKAHIKSSKKWHDDWVLYKGMSKIKEDMIFMDYFVLLFNRMWT